MNRPDTNIDRQEQSKIEQIQRAQTKPIEQKLQPTKGEPIKCFRE